MRLDKFTTKFQQALGEAQSLAIGHDNQMIEPQHLLLALFNQDDLIALRTACGVHELLPGLTGWAQINGRDDLPIPEKVTLDAEYLRRRSLGFDLHILWCTWVKVVRRDGVSH